MSWGLPYFNSNEFSLQIDFIVKILEKITIYISFVNFEPAVCLTRIYSLICFAIKHEYMGYTNDSIMLVWHLRTAHFIERTVRYRSLPKPFVILTIWFMIFLTRIQKLEIMFGEGDNFPKSSLSQVWPGLSLTFSWRFCEENLNFYLRFFKIFGKSWFIHVWPYLNRSIILGGNVKGRFGNSSKHFRHTLMHFQRTFHYLKVYQ